MSGIFNNTGWKQAEDDKHGSRNKHHVGFQGFISVILCHWFFCGVGWGYAHHAGTQRASQNALNSKEPCGLGWRSCLPNIESLLRSWKWTESAGSQPPHLGAPMVTHTEELWQGSINMCTAYPFWKGHLPFLSHDPLDRLRSRLALQLHKSLQFFITVCFTRSQQLPLVTDNQLSIKKKKKTHKVEGALQQESQCIAAISSDLAKIKLPAPTMSLILGYKNFFNCLKYYSCNFLSPTPKLTNLQVGVCF